MPRIDQHQDQLFSMALQAAVRDSAELEAQLRAKDGSSPILRLIAHARKEAAEAFLALFIVKPDDADKVRELQNEIARYDDMLNFIRKILVAGVEADQRLTGADREELLDTLMGQPGGAEQAVEMGLIDADEGAYHHVN